MIGAMASPDEPRREGSEAGAGGASEPVLKLRADAVDWREVEGQVVALDRAGSVYLAINQTGTALWPAIVKGARRSQLVEILLDTFDVDPVRAAADVDAFVANLSDRFLVERSG